MNKKLLINLIIIGLILFLINKISKKSIKNILSDYFNKIKNVFNGVLDNKDKKDNIDNIDNKNNIENNENKDNKDNNKITSNKINSKNNNNKILEKNKKDEPIKILPTKKELMFKKVHDIIKNKIRNVELPLNVSIPKKCSNNDIKNIKIFIKNQYDMNNLEIIDNIDYFYNNDLYEIKPINISCHIYDNKNLLCETQIELSMVFKENHDDNIFSSEYNFNNKQGNYLINDFKILNIQEVNIQKNNLKLESFDTNSIDSLIPDNAFSSEYEKDSSIYTTESIINLDTA